DVVERQGGETGWRDVVERQGGETGWRDVVERQGGETWWRDRVERREVSLNCDEAESCFFCCVEDRRPGLSETFPPPPNTWVPVSSSFFPAAMGNHGSNLDDILAEDMHHWYNKFMKESPSGLITLFELKAILGLKGMTENANSYVDQDGYIDFVEYIAAVSLMLKGEINQKLKWYFKLFDQDGNGKIDKDELETIFTAIQDITRNRETSPEDIVSIIFERIDLNGEGALLT
ncbi:hypothetical protein F7725_006360, partial [Dissostichus mawsoni]